MLTFFVFLNVWWLSIKKGALCGHWRWLSMLAFVLGLLLLDDIAYSEWARFMRGRSS